MTVLTSILNVKLKFTNNKEHRQIYRENHKNKFTAQWQPEELKLHGFGSYE